MNYSRLDSRLGVMPPIATSKNTAFAVTMTRGNLLRLFEYNMNKLYLHILYSTSWAWRVFFILVGTVFFMTWLVSLGLVGVLQEMWCEKNEKNGQCEKMA